GIANGVETIAAIHSLEGGTCTFGVLRNAAYYDLSDLVQRFHRRHPLVKGRRGRPAHAARPRTPPGRGNQTRAAGAAGRSVGIEDHPRVPRGGAVRLSPPLPPEWRGQH